MRRAQRPHRYCAAIGQCQILSAGGADPHRRQPGRLGGADQRGGVRHGEHVAALVLAEPVGVAGDVPRAGGAAGRRSARPSPSRPPRPAGRRRTRRGRRGRCRRGSARGRNRRCARSAARSTGGGAPSSRPAISRSQSDWPSQPCGRADQHDVEPRPAARCRPPSPHRPARRGRRWPASAGSPARAGRIARFVVEADIAGHDREVERLAGRRHAADRGGELAHDLGPFGVAEVHVVGERQRPRADGGQVAPGLGHRLRAAGLGVGGAVARRAVGGQRQRARQALELHHRGVGGARGASRSARRRCCRTGPTPRRASRDRGRRSASTAPRSGRRDPRPWPD